MKRIRLALGVAVVAVAAAGLAGCGGNEPSSEESSSVAPPSEIPSSLPSDVPTGKTGKLPDGFPLPKGAKKEGFSEASGKTAGRITVQDGGEAYDFWVEELPKKGYEVGEKQKVEVGGVGGSYINFSGNGYSNGKLAIADTTATVTLTKKK